MARRNTYREDEVLETPFDYHHLLRAFVYIKKYLGMMIFALILSAIGGITGLFGPMITQRALDEAIPNKDIRMLFILVASSADHRDRPASCLDTGLVHRGFLAPFSLFFPFALR